MDCAPLVIALLCLCGCGGSSTRHQSRNDTGTGGAAGSGAGGSNGGVAGSAGVGGSSAAAGTCEGEACVGRYVMLADFESGYSNGDLQIAGSQAANYIAEIEPPRGGSLRALHLSDIAELGGCNLGFHQHQPPFWLPDEPGPGEPYVAVRFWARGSSSLVFAITGLAHERGDYQADLEGGNPWLAQRFALTGEWRQYVVLFSELAAEGPGTEAPVFDAGGQVLHWLVPSGEPLDLWLDDLELGCARGVCQ